MNVGTSTQLHRRDKYAFEQDLPMLQTWKAALTHVANLSGWDVRDKPQSAEIEKIVEETMSILDYKFSSVPNDLVGWQSPVQELEKLLLLSSDDDVRVLGICGMGGIGAGSRIIIISRDEHILRDYGVDIVYNVQLLNDDNALRLFCRKAFKCDDFERDYRTVIYDALKYAKGLPIAIRVLASFLYGRDVFEWRSALARLREYPRTDIMDVLRISYDGLEDMEKEIFLDIACFFDTEEETYVTKILNFRGFHPDIGIRVLADKSLITRKSGCIYMHGLLIELGRSIVREKSPKEPRKWSRLWDYEDLQNVMFENKASENIEAIVLQRNLVKISGITMRVDALSQLSRLTLLLLRNVKFSGSLGYLSNELGYLYWDKYPFPCLPSSFQANKLVELILPHSNIKQLWEGTKSLYNLRHMDLSHSKNLIKIPDFREVPNLESLELERCIKLVRIDPSISFLKKLVLLNLKNCINLVSIPKNIMGLSSLEVLNLSGCSKLNLLMEPRHVKHLKMFDTSETGFYWRSTSFISKMLMLPIHFFYPRRQEEPIGLFLSSLPNFPCLCDLDLSFCNLIQIPDSIGSLRCLERLNLGGNSFVTLPSSIKKLSTLRYLNLEHCKQLKYLPQLPSITVLSARREHYSGSYAGLYIFNCRSLCEPEHCRRMAISWMIQVFELLMQSYLPFNKIAIVIPGSQIPRWFDKQNVGCSISMYPSPIVHDNNWIGVACCSTFVAHHNPTYLCDEWEPYIGIGFRKKYLFGRITMIPINLSKDLVTVELDHLLLLFFTRQEFIDLFGSSVTEGTRYLDGIEMETIIRSPQGLHLEVKNIGYRWVFIEDLQLLNTIMIHSRNSPVLKRKFLTVDDEPHP